MSLNKLPITNKKLRILTNKTGIVTINEMTKDYEIDISLGFYIK